MQPSDEEGRLSIPFASIGKEYLSTHQYYFFLSNETNLQTEAPTRDIEDRPKPSIAIPTNIDIFLHPRDLRIAQVRPIKDTERVQDED